jgi:hypothetical protein
MRTQRRMLQTKANDYKKQEAKKLRKLDAVQPTLL